MIVRDCTILLKNESASLSDTLVLYKGDQNIEYTFTLKDNAYKFSNSTDGNIVTQLEASYSQILLYKNPSIRVTFPVQETKNGKVILKIVKELIDESNEVGDYDLQIRLYDSNKEAILTLPPLVKAIHVKSPLFESVSTDSALADVTIIDETGPEEVIFGEDGNYLKTTWTPGMIITSEKLNKIEGALYKNTSDIKEIGQQKYDDITLIDNELSMKANGIIKKTVTLPNVGGTVEGHTHANKSTLDKITDEKILGWNNKAEGNHNHDTLYAKKTEIPVVDVTKQYVDDELAKKSPIHEHPYLSQDTVIPTKTSELTNDSGYLTGHQDISGKVDKVEGKGLSTNDLTNALKTNYDSAYTHSQESHAPSNAEVNVQSDWNESDTSSDAYIKNKPTIPNEYVLPVASATVLGGVKVGAGLSISNGVLSATGGGTADSIDWSNIQNKPSVFNPATHKHSYNDLTDKPTIPTVSNDLTNTLKSNYDSAYAHSQIDHAPKEAQKNSDITKQEIEAKLIGNITTHTHNQYLTEHQDISNLALKSEIIKSYNDLIDKPTIPIVDVTKQYVDTELGKKSPIHEHPYLPNSYIPNWDNIQNKPSVFTPATHKHSEYLTEHQSLDNYVQKETGKGLSTNDLTTALKTNYDISYTHSKSTHAPSNAQKNSDITKAEIEAKLTGQITSHTHTVEVPKDTLITTNIVGTSLELTTDKYQTTKMVNDTEIILPSVTNFTEIHLFFSASTDMTVILPNCKWQSQPTINANKSYELIFTYTTGWLGGCVVYE